MKNRLLIVLLFISCIAFAAKAQDRTQLPFFDERGLVRLQTTELDALADTIAVVWHRETDIAWRRTVYRVIDMRDNQNHRLYFPVRPDNREYRNLFKVMLDAICDNGLTAYERGVEFMPRFDRPLTPEDLRANLQLKVESEFDENAYLIDIDAFGAPHINEGNFAYYMRDQLKFVIQEIVFFNRHTSRMYTKIQAIAPLYSAHPYRQEVNPAVAFHTSILFWVLFDELRPFLARQYTINTSNEAQRLTFDDFFTLRMYNSYLLGNNNVFGRMLLDYDRVVDERRLEQFIRMEQQRIETELMNFEQDLWEW
jgi:gliding motility associated protien GldN